MSHQRQFEGPDVRALLDEICAEYGTEPTIAKAETFRTGGVLGFFQREQYRLVVEDPNGPPAPAKANRRQAKSVAPRLRTTSAQAAALRALEAAPGPVDAPTGEHSAVSVGPAEAVTVDPAEAVTVDPAEAAAPRPPVATATVQQAVGAYSQVAAGRYDDEPTADEFLASLVEPTPVAAAPATGDMFADVAAGTTDQVELSGAAPPPSPAPAAGPDLTAAQVDDSFEAVLRRVSEAVGAETAETAETAGAEACGAETSAADGIGAEVVEWPRIDRSELFSPPVVVDEQVERPAPGAEPAAVTQTWAEEEAEPAAVTQTWAEEEAEPAGVTQTSAEEEIDPVSAAAREARRLQARRLLDTGLHHRTVVAVLDAIDEGWSLEASILDAMEDLPLTQAPRHDGSLIVVLGPGRRAAEEATRMAGEVGGDPSRVAFATDRRPVWQAPDDLLLTSAAAARAVRPSLVDGSIGLVAVDAPTGSRASTMSWARYILDALQPTHVVAIADAMHKNEDVAAWIEVLGGVDSLVVDNTDLTTSPATILELGLPVSRLGQKPATPARWAATVLDRLEEGVAAETLDLTNEVPTIIDIEAEMSKWG